MNKDQLKHPTHVASFHFLHTPLRSELLRRHLRKLSLKERRCPWSSGVRNRVRFRGISRARSSQDTMRRHPMYPRRPQPRDSWLSPKSHRKKQAGGPRSSFQGPPCKVLAPSRLPFARFRQVEGGFTQVAPRACSLPSQAARSSTGQTDTRSYSLEHN